MAFNLDKLCPTAVKRTCLPSDKMLIPNRLVGIEVEVEGWPYPTNDTKNPISNHISEFWAGKADGSLRNNGIEFMTQPILGSDIISALALFEEGMAQVAAKIKFSVRTSVHVHVDVRDLTSEELRSVILMYSILERLIFNEIFPTRRDSVFCVPLYSENGVKNRIVSIFDSIAQGEQNKVFDTLRSTPRYMGLNLAAIIKYSTIEFRHSIGTARKEVLTNWLNTIFGIINAKDIPYNVLVDSLVDTKQVQRLIARAFKWHYGYLETLPNYTKHINAGIGDSIYLTGGLDKSVDGAEKVELDKSQYFKARGDKFEVAKKQKKEQGASKMGSSRWTIDPFAQDQFEVLNTRFGPAAEVRRNPEATRIIEDFVNGTLAIDNGVANTLGILGRGRNENIDRFIQRVVARINVIRAEDLGVEAQTGQVRQPNDVVRAVSAPDTAIADDVGPPAPRGPAPAAVLAAVERARRDNNNNNTAENEVPDWWEPPTRPDQTGFSVTRTTLGLIRLNGEDLRNLARRILEEYHASSMATKRVIYQQVLAAQQRAALNNNPEQGFAE